MNFHENEKRIIFAVMTVLKHTIFLRKSQWTHLQDDVLPKCIVLDESVEPVPSHNGTRNGLNDTLKCGIVTLGYPHLSRSWRSGLHDSRWTGELCDRELGKLFPCKK